MANGEGHPEHDYDGWNTLVGVKEGAAWKLASWQIANETVEDVADWGTKTKLVRFVAQKK